MTQQKYAVSAKIWQVSEMSSFSKNKLCQQKLAELSTGILLTQYIVLNQLILAKLTLTLTLTLNPNPSPNLNPNPNPTKP